MDAALSVRIFTILWLSTLTALAQGTMFTYQGRLQEAAANATGGYDFRFALWDALSGGAICGGPLTNTATPVNNGQFIVQLDFGSAVFNGLPRWIEIAVRTNGATEGFTPLAPRQQLTTTPYAIRAANYSGAIAAGQIQGTLSPANIAAGTITGMMLTNGAIGPTQMASGAAAANLAASGQSGIPSGGIVLSTNSNDSTLLASGYVKIGDVNIPDVWENDMYGFGDREGRPPAQNGTAVWTGSRMLVWGGTVTDGYARAVNGGGQYEPIEKTWMAITTNGVPTARQLHTAVWSGAEMIVWGGSSYDGPPNWTETYFNDGGRFNPISNSWSSLNTSGAPTARYGHTAVWTGTEMIVWGGYWYDGTTHYYNNGGRYNPVSNTWGSVSTANAPAGRYYHTAVWTGTEMIVWGGYGSGHDLNSGGRYNPASDTWAALPITGAPTATSYPSSVWTGDNMLVAKINSMGGCYSPSSNVWEAISGMSTTGLFHMPVWTGTEMILDGACYDPKSKQWTPVSTVSAPSGGIAERKLPTVWTGNVMVVYAGRTYRYKPAQLLFLYQKH